jgi:hypothetical protein
MLYRQSLIEELSNKRADFTDFGRAWAEQARDYVGRLRELDGRSVAEIKASADEGVATGVARTPSALPTKELEREGSFVVPFAREWRTHEEARAWAVDALLDRVTFAADGSQLLPGREISLPVAAVQVAWFENPHTRDGSSYRKEWDFSLVTPKELLETEGAAMTAADLVGLRRVVKELEAVRAFLKRRAGWRERKERVPVAFFDGTLLLSTSRVRGEALKSNPYIAAIVETVKLSRETRVPLVGYIDQSYARDIARMIDVLARRRTQTPTVFDAQIFAAAAGDDAPLFARWGDRSIFCECLREGLTEEFWDEAGQPLVGFLYLQTTAPGSTPARLDIPTWVAEEEGLIEDVANAVRAECVVGNGYPYALETADEAAVITIRDREQFLRAVQDFAEANDLPFRVSRKAVSKMHRR